MLQCRRGPCYPYSHYPIKSNAMKTPDTPFNEQERLAALYELLLLDTPPEQRFDTIVEFAASEFDVPIALITLVDRDRQWFKARTGLDAAQTPREIAFCASVARPRPASETASTRQLPEWSALDARERSAQVSAAA